MLNFKQPLQNTESNRKDNLRNLCRTHHGDKMDTPMRIDLTRPGLKPVDHVKFMHCCYGRPWPAVYINFVLKIHQIQVLTEPLCRAQASFYALPNNKRDTKYRGLTYSARQNCP